MSMLASSDSCTNAPHEASALRLISAVLAEIHEEWLTDRQYLNLAGWKKQGGAILPYRP